MARGRIPLMLSTLLIGGFVLVGHAGVAQAASQTVTTDCYSDATIPISLEVGETLTINTALTGGCAEVQTLAGTGVTPRGVGEVKYGPTGTENTLPYNAGPVPFPFGTRIIYTATAEGSIRIQMEDDYPFSTDMTNFDITVIAASNDGGTDSISAPVAGPSDLLQQVGKPAGGCQSITAPELNWAGVPNGGWHESWAQWVNGGEGGTVCTRTLAYSTSTNAWFVRQ